MRFVRHASAPLILASFALSFSACSSGDDTPSGGSGMSAGATGGTGGGSASGGSAGTTTTGGTGTGGSTGGTAGAGTAGSAAGSGGTSAGRGGAGAAGTSGSAGSNVGGAGMSGSVGSGGAPNAGAGGLAGSAGAGAGGLSSGGSGSGSGGSGGAGGSTSGGTFTVTNPDFMNVTGCSQTMQSVCDTFPRELAQFMSGPNISPELDWTGVPAGTKSFAVLLQDLSNGYSHWVIWNIPGTATMLAADVPKTSNMPSTPAGSQQTNASFASGDGYYGPGSACNVYEYVVFALAMDKFTPTSTTNSDAVRTALMALDDSQLLGTASIRGRQAACSNNQTCDSNNMCAN